MGGGNYSSVVNSDGTRSFDSSIRKTKLYSKGIDVDSMSRDQIFKSRSLNSAMNPYGVQLRESRDSVEHPESLAIIFGLDVTGSMMQVPHFLVKEGLPHIMGKLIQKGIEHPQVLFVAIGDHECDNAPLQIGQFESGDDQLDQWLTDVYLEGGGGGNAGESYLLAWYFAGYHTSIDCFEKRGTKGFLITIGDEPCLKTLPQRSLKGIMGDGQYEDFKHFDLLSKAQEKYDVYHINVTQTGKGRLKETQDSWSQLLADRFINVDRQEDIADVISDLIIKREIKMSPRVSSEKENVSQTPKTEEVNFIV